MLSVRNLTVSLGTGEKPLDLVQNVSLDIARGEILGVVGESGCGKSMTSLAIMGLLPKPVIDVRHGQVLLDGKDITRLTPFERVEQNCSGISMVFQEPMTSLNPVMRTGDQITEALKVHDREANRSPELRAKELLDLVHIPDAALQLRAYPHELSGGMRQRVMIAIALACNPQVLVADEPTTALDVTIQSQILGLIRELCDELSVAVMFITHDLGVVAQLADRVAVMYAGQVIETAGVEDLFDSHVHPYTDGLFNCLPDPSHRTARLDPIVGQAPRAGEITDGCPFAPRCNQVTEICQTGWVDWTKIASGHQARCHHPLSASEAS
jgi:oligopeptide/dipeptide ABC transporter ATP-binding protein